MGRHNVRLGASGEDRVADWYRRAGYRLLDRNWRCRDGELDLVLADRRHTVVFCEVKTRSSTRYGTPAEAVGPAKQDRLRRLALRWLSDHDVRARRVRFDVAGVVGEQVSVIEAAF